MLFETDYRILSMMIAPALFMTATGSLILSSNNRLARIVDRIRVLIAQYDALEQPSNTLDFPELRREAIILEVQHLTDRNIRVRNATALLYLAFAFFVAASLHIGIDLLFAQNVPMVPTLLAFAGVTSLLWACLNLFREMRTASQTVNLELDFLKRLQAERRLLRPGKDMEAIDNTDE